MAEESLPMEIEAAIEQIKQREIYLYGVLQEFLEQAWGKVFDENWLAEITSSKSGKWRVLELIVKVTSSAVDRILPRKEEVAVTGEGLSILAEIRKALTEEAQEGAQEEGESGGNES